MNFSIRTVATVGAALFVIAASSVPAAADTLRPGAGCGERRLGCAGIEAQTGDTFNITAHRQVITFLPPKWGGSNSGPDGQAGTCTSANGFVCAVEGRAMGRADRQVRRWRAVLSSAPACPRCPPTSPGTAASGQRVRRHLVRQQGRVRRQGAVSVAALESGRHSAEPLRRWRLRDASGRTSRRIGCAFSASSCWSVRG